MNTTKLLRSKSFLIAVFSVAVPSLAQPPGSQDAQEVERKVQELYHVPISVVLKNTQPGDASLGVVVTTIGDALFIDPAPCVINQQKRIFVFVQPYKQTKVSDAKCNGRSYEQVQVIQR